MKNFKRILALVIAVIMVVGTTAGLSAAGGKWYSKAVAFIENNSIAIIGSHADDKLTRNEFVLWVAKLESHQLSDAAWNDEIAGTSFSDVTEEHHRAAIAYSERRGFIIGNGDGTFSPDKYVTLAEACAVIVRLMGYENKVDDTSDENWKYNYMEVANTYAHAIDEVFLKETDTYNPDYELSYGEAAYLLATIMNFNKTPTDSDYSETSDGINLGEWFELNGGSMGTVGKAYLVSDIERIKYADSLSTLIHLGGKKGEIFTNELNTAASVTLLAADGSGEKLVIDGEAFLKLLRVSLGLDPIRDIANEEAEINVFAYADIGSLINVVVDKSASGENATSIPAAGGEGSRVTVTSVNPSENSVIVDTYLQATSAQLGTPYGDGSVGATSETNLIISADDLSKFVGWTIREIGTTENTVPVLPATYNESLATSWTNIVRDKDNVITSAVLNFKGVGYKIDGANDEIDIYMGDDLTTVLTPDEAVNAIINAAQGECYVVFNDIDGDGEYDNAVVKESDPFYYIGTPNVQGATTNAYDYYSSISGGTIIGNAQMKGNNLGVVIWNKKVEFAAGGTSGVADYRTDGYKLVDSNTGKMQLVLRPSNKHFFIDGATTAYGNATPHFYQVVDLATFGVGVIEEIDAFALDDYFIAKIAQTDGTTKTVYIPVTPNEKTTFTVSIGGASAEYVFDSSTWCQFLTEDVKEAIIDSGIVSGVQDPGYKQATAAWMVGKYVQFATNEDNEVVVILGTDSTTSTSGFVTGVQKTETGDNTYNVSIATSGSGTVENEAYYLEAALQTSGANAGKYVVTTPWAAIGQEWGEITRWTYDTVQWGKLNVFRGWTNYHAHDGINGARSLLYSDNNGTPNMGDGIHAALNGNDGYNKWTVGTDGIVRDQDGKQVAFQRKTEARFGVGGVSTYEVRASASSMFDWDNYEVYNAIFAGKLGDPNGMKDGKVNPGEDLIYVTVMQDAGSLKYLKYGDNTNGSSSLLRNDPSSGIREAYYTSGTSKPLFTVIGQGYSAPTAHESWLDVEGEYIISIEEIEGSRVVADDGSSYTAEYTALVGFGPYYVRTATANGYTYVLRFTKVVEYTSVDGTATAVIDKAKTLMIPLYKGESGTQSEQVQAVTDEDFEKYTIANGYYIDDITHLVYLLVEDAEIVFEKDDQGNIIYSDVVYDWESGKAANTYTDGKEVLFDTYDIDRYTTFSATAKSSTDEGYFPGAMYVNLDGKTYQAVNTMPVIIVTPSADGFEITTTTLANIPSEGLFATTWNGVESNGSLVAIAIIGDVTGSDEVVVPADDTTLVYLDSSAKAIVRAGEFSANWIVVSDKPAYALPSGEEIGVIYREYSTYEDAKKAASIDLTVVGGHWYKVDENGKIISDMTNVVYEEFDGVVVDTNDYTMTEGNIYSQSFYLVDGEYRIANLQYTNGVLTGITAGDAFVPTVDVSSLSATNYLIPATGVEIYERANDTTFYKNADGKYVLVTVEADNTLTEGAEIDVYNLAWAIDQMADSTGYKATYRVESEAEEQLIYKYTSVTGDFYFIETLVDGDTPTSKYVKVTLTETAEEGRVVMTVTEDEVTISDLEPFKITSAIYDVITVEDVTVYTFGGISFLADPTGKLGKTGTEVTVTPIEGAAEGAPNAVITEGAEVTMDAIVAGLEPVQTIDEPATKTVTVYEYYGELYILASGTVGEEGATYTQVEEVTFTYGEKSYTYLKEVGSWTKSVPDDSTKSHTVTVIGSTESITVYTEQIRKDANGAYSFTKTDGTAISGAPAIVYNIADFSLVSGNAVNGAYTNGTAYVIVVDGEYYPADSNYRRVETSSVVSGLKQGTITKADAAGNTWATIDGIENVNVSSYKFEFFYRNADGTVLYKAGDSTNVTVASRAIYEAQIKTQQDAYDKAVAAYEEALSKDYLSEERLAYYKEEVERTEAELLEAKDSLLDKYFNGRFWNVPNSPYYTYVQLGQGSFQQPTSSLTFTYVLVGDTYCVFSDEFVLG